jgi:putative addiction module antidote
MIRLKIHKVGDALGVALPKEVLAKLNLGEGDALFLAEIQDGVVLSPRELTQVDVLRAVARRYDATMRILAK